MLYSVLVQKDDLSLAVVLTYQVPCPQCDRTPRSQLAPRSICGKLPGRLASTKSRRHMLFHLACGLSQDTVWAEAGDQTASFLSSRTS